jgi:hypothetical protein
MSTVTVSGYHTGYSLQAPNDTLSIAADGTIGAGGVASGITNTYTVINSGRIGNHAAPYGVLIYRGGTVINDLGGSITSGVSGVILGAGYEGRGTHTSFGSVVNRGSIVGGSGDGIYLDENLLQGAFVTNGGVGNTGALVSGANGIDDVAGIFATIATTIDNFGTIQGTGGAGFAGISMDEGSPGTIVNGSSLDTAAVISGYIGVDDTPGGAMVLQNFGTIEATGSVAVLLGSSADTLIDEAQAAFIGTVDGAGGTLQLAADAGAGTLTGLGTNFTNFSNVSINSGATWTLTGGNTIAPGATLTDGGTLIDTGSISGGIDLAANGALLSIAGGGYLSNAGTGSAVYSRYAVSVVNQGTIEVQAPGASVAGYYGVRLANGGSVDNSGIITGNNFAGLRLLGGVSVTNSGLIASGRAGVFADFGVNIDNIGRIDGPVNGVFARNGAVTITNSGTIWGNNAIWVLNGTGTITNAGTLQGLADRAVSLTAGGTVANQAGGLITAPGNNVAVYIGGANYTATAEGFVTNAGTIAAGTGIAFYAGDMLSQTVIDSGTIIGSNGTAIAFSAGDDTLRLQPSTSVFIQGVVNGGGGTNTLAFASAATTGTLTGVGADFVNFAAATIDAGASWVLAGSDTFASSVTLTDAGMLTNNGTLTNNGSFIVTGSVLNTGIIDGNPPNDIVIDMRAGSSLTNQSGGLIDGSGEGILLHGGGTVLNAGSIGGSDTGVDVAGGSLTNQSGGTISGYQGVDASGAAMLVNAGRISGDIDGPVGCAVVLLDGGQIANQAGGVIDGYWGINAILDPATVVNAGSIGGNMTGARGAGVFLFQGGAVSNQSGGVISGDRGVAALYADATVMNAGMIDGNPGGGFGIALLAGGSVTNQSGGTISGGAGAVTLAAGHTNRVVIDPGALFIGAVDGGNAIGATAVSTLELAAAAGAGTLTGLGSQFLDFANVTIDSGAGWVLTGGNTIGAGVNLLDGGGLTVAGSLLNDGAATLSSSLVVTGTLSNLGSIDVASYRGLELSSGGYLYNAAGATIARSSSGPVFDPTVFATGGGSVAIRNQGTITDAAGDITLYLHDGGTITNGSAGDTTALIEGEVGVYIDAGRGIVSNFGTIETSAGGGPGIELNQGGSIVNGASGSTAASILGAQYGVFGVDGPTTLTNFGTVAASDNGFGFYQRFGTATVFNAGVIGATNGSGVGVALQGGGTVVDSGTIEGANTAVRFGGTGSNVLVLEQGYAFFGLVQGSASASNTLELVGSVGAAVTVNHLDLGVGLVNFQTVEFGPGAGNAATLDINNDAALPGTIAGFVGFHDTIDLTALSDIGNDATTSFNAATDVLTVTGDNGSVALQLDAEDYTGVDWAAQNDGAGGTAVHVVPIVPPVISGTAAGQATTDEAAARPFASVGISDADPGQIETVTITLSSAANGSLSSNVGGSYDAATGIYSITGSDAAVTEAVDALVFTPTPHQVAPGDTITTSFTIQVTDTAGATTSNNTTTVTTTAVNDTLSITNVVAALAEPNDAPATPFAGLTISDPDVGHIDTVTVTLSNAAGGALSNLGGGSYDAAAGVYTVSGSVEAVNAALQGLVFTPTTPAEGFVSTTGFTVVVTGPGGTASDDSISVTSVQQVLGLAGAAAGNIVISLSPDGSSFPLPTAGRDNEAVITDPSNGASYSLPAGYQAAFLGGSANATLTDTSSGNALLVGNGGDDMLVSGAANDTILGGSATTTIQFTSAATGGMAFGGAGDAIILDAGRNDTLAGASGTTAATIAGSSAVFLSQGSDANVVDSGANATLVGGSFQSSFQLTAGATGAVVFGGAGSATIADAGSDDTIAGAAGTTSVTTSGSNTAFFGEAGATTVVDSGQDNVLAGGSGASTFLLTSGATGSAVFGGAGTAAIVDAGSDDTIAGAAGATSATISGSNAVFFGQAGNVTLLDTGLGGTIAAGSGSTDITDVGSGAVVFGGSGALNFVGGTSGATIAGGSGSMSVAGGSGGTTLFGASGGAIRYTGDAGDLLYAAGSGNETLDASGSSTNDVMVGGQDRGGRDLIIGGAGNDVLAAGGGSDTLVGGAASHDVFVFFSSDGGIAANDVVMNFSANDTVWLSGYGAAAAGDALSGATSSGGSTTITLADNTRITFSDIASVASLSGHIVST